MLVIDDICPSIVRALEPSVNPIHFRQMAALTIGFYCLDNVVW